MICYDYTKITEHLKKNYEPECRQTLATAEDAVARRFIFNQRWDMERTYEYVAFPDDIDFLHQPGGDPEWTFAFNRLKHFNSLAEAWHLTGEKKYLLTLLEQMKRWMETVRQSDPEAGKAWRTIETGIRLDTLSKVWLMVRETKEAETIRTLVEASIDEHAESILSRSWNSYHLMSNWGVLSNHGLYVASIIFERPEWERIALTRLTQELRNEVYDDGMQWEQSPMYHNEVTRDFLDVVLLSRYGTIRLEDWFMEKVHKMALVNLKSIKPDGCEPLMGDSDEIDMRDLVTKSAYAFKDPFLKAVGYGELDYETSWVLGEEAIEEYRKLECKEPQELDYFLSSSGNGYARSSWKEDADYLRFHAGTLGAGHGHADQSHVSFVLEGRDLLCDSGRYTYVPGRDRYDFKDNYAHNVLVVDKRSLYPEKDSWECYSLDRAVNVRSSFKGDIVAFEGGHLGYYRDGVFLNRRIVWLKNEKLLFVVDEAYSSGNHTYEQLFHFSEDLNLDIAGREASAGKARIYLRSEAELKLEKRTGSISRHYNQRCCNEVLCTEATRNGFFSLWTIFDLKGEAGLEVERSTCVSNFKGIEFPASTMEAVKVRGKDREVVLVVAHEEFASPTDTFNAFGRTGFGNVVVFPDKKERSIGIRLFC